MSDFLVAAVAVVGFFAGMTASVAGFGIGSFFIPRVIVQTGTKIALALASGRRISRNRRPFLVTKS